MYFLHPNTQGLPYASIEPLLFTFSGVSFSIDYPGFNFCDSLGCKKSYPPITIHGHVFCCEGVAMMLVYATRSQNTRKKLIGYPTVYTKGPNGLFIESEHCETSVVVSLFTHQSYLDNLNCPIDSVEGFTIQQALFYDLEQTLVCPCTPVTCPPGFTWNQDECQCKKTTTECRDTQRIYLTIQLVVPVSIDLQVVLKYKGSPLVTTVIPVNLSVETGLSWKLLLGEIEYDGSLTQWLTTKLFTTVGDWLVSALFSYSSVQLLGPPGKILSDTVNIGFDTEIVNRSNVNGECICLPPPGGCPPGTTWNQVECNCKPFHNELPPPPDGFRRNPAGDGYEVNRMTSCEWFGLTNSSTGIGGDDSCCSQDMSIVLGDDNLRVLDDGIINLSKLSTTIDHLPDHGSPNIYVFQFGSYTYGFDNVDTSLAKFYICGWDKDHCECYGPPPNYLAEPPPPCKPWVGYWLDGISPIPRKFDFQQYCGNAEPKGPGIPWIPFSPPVQV